MTVRAVTVDVAAAESRRHATSTIDIGVSGSAVHIYAHGGGSEQRVGPITSIDARCVFDTSTTMPIARVMIKLSIAPPSA